MVLGTAILLIDHNPEALYSHHLFGLTSFLAPPLAFLFVLCPLFTQFSVLLVSGSIVSSTVVGRVGYALVKELFLLVFAPSPLGFAAFVFVSLSDLFSSFLA